ncbi:hypothetical protein EJ04DRAFT_539190 [Polyplosphaeria fusca]|uniref:Zn(2)-C6 fungal-type domain-containing protein n=1 Tax=Polyplosphaeria fusca TaxID=682080 RepID=A0A9P4QLD6_9PLEO|nr:hypothetical protein EJ04DRAFT_539190 [Polyplosphaeria fusca]
MPEPACATCRRKSRRCDRRRPHCLRCISKGLECEGYPLCFKMYNVKTQTSYKSRKAQRIGARRSASSSANEEDTHEGPPTRMQEAMLSIQLNDLSTPAKGDVEEVHQLLAYYETTICSALPVPSSSFVNPFKSYILPLAHTDSGLLNGVLGLTACHLAIRDRQPNSCMATNALQHRLVAIRSMSSLLIKEQRTGLSSAEEDIALATVLTLVLHDICECGMSTHGAHLNGVAFLCSRIAMASSDHSPLRLFLVTALTWFDLLRGFSGAEKLAFPPDTRKFVAEKAALTLHTLFGCPVEIFEAISHMMSAGKMFWAKDIDTPEFQQLLDPIHAQLQAWDPKKGHYPDEDVEWALLANAYRHTAILRVLRFPDPWLIPCTDNRIRSSVEAILDSSAKMSWHSPYFKRLIFPLFVAGAETASPHQQRYITLCVDHIRELTGFTNDSISELLGKIWEDRRKSEDCIPWFEYTCSVNLQRQHDYLFF